MIYASAGICTWLGKKAPVFKKWKQIWMIQLPSPIPCVPWIPSVATLLTLATSFGDGCCAQNKSVSKSKRLLEHKAHRLDLLLNFFSNAGQQKQIQRQKVVDASRLDLFLNPFPNCQDQAKAWARCKLLRSQSKMESSTNIASVTDKVMAMASSADLAAWLVVFQSCLIKVFNPIQIATHDFGDCQQETWWKGSNPVGWSNHLVGLNSRWSRAAIQI